MFKFMSKVIRIEMVIKGCVRIINGNKFKKLK